MTSSVILLLYDNARSPVHPDSYFHNTNCTWVITAPQGQVVEVKFDFLELESNSRCRYDYVAAYDGPRINNTRLRHELRAETNVDSLIHFL